MLFLKHDMQKKTPEQVERKLAAIKKYSEELIVLNIAAKIRKNIVSY